ncbi:MAG: hypothetical protein R8N23_05400 [Reichenbachiella sp.]|uniref:hypothetical protein n=1 Tax=Reichenbachiella sp. TaxID=2184521 RepID=UPI002966185A|nr:hypothetical protein [Reichenbachiella sp.]MDW3209279.1 hypothetical protein [Reichenbachiella sp.]
MKEIPLISTITSLYKLSNSIQDKIFYRKVAKFLSEIENFTQNELDDIMLRIEADKEYSENFGLILLEIIDKTNGDKKPKLLSILFSAFGNKMISLDEFFKFSNIINLAHISDLKKLTTKKIISSEQASAVLGLGIIQLISMSGKVQFGGMTGGLHYSLNETGKKFISIIENHI